MPDAISILSTIYIFAFTFAAIALAGHRDKERAREQLRYQPGPITIQTTICPTCEAEHQVAVPVGGGVILRCGCGVTLRLTGAVPHA